MDNKSDEQLLIIQSTININKQDYDDKMKKQVYKLDNLMAIMENMMDHIQISDPSSENMDSPKAQGPNTAVLDKKKAPSLDGGHSTKIGGMWNIKHEINSPKFYELIINT